MYDMGVEIIRGVVGWFGDYNRELGAKIFKE